MRPCGDTRNHESHGETERVGRSVDVIGTTVGPTNLPSKLSLVVPVHWKDRKIKALDFQTPHPKKHEQTH